MNKTILWTDDSRFVRSAGRMILNKLDLAMREAENGQAALQALEKYDDIAAIVLDLNMPVMDGCSFLRELARRPDLPQPPVILCTTEADMPLIVEAIRAGAAEYINKPCSFEDIRDKLIAVGVLDRSGFLAGKSTVAGAAC